MGYVAIHQVDGRFKLFEFVRGEEEPLTCEGQAELVGNDMKSKVTCENGRQFTQILYDFSKIQNFYEFDILMASSLYGMDTKVEAVFNKTSREELSHRYGIDLDL